MKREDKSLIFIGDNLLSKINQLFNFAKFSKIGILTDTNIKHHWLPIVKKGIKKRVIPIIISPGEKSKTIETVKKIWREMFENGFDRQSLLINLGGGVIGDIGGFAAATFMRGIEFLNIPTTLLAQADASIGGKTGINFQEIKNSIGVLKDPIGVVIDVKTLKTLPKRELIAAFGEIIKHGIISGREHFNLVTSKRPEEFNQRELIKIIKQSVKIKLNIVQKDPKEIIGLRRVLNFGHTIGHAIESLSLKTNESSLHGEAIAVGMAAESKLAELLGLLSNKDFKKIENSLINAGLPVNIKNINSKDIEKMILSDKKNSAGKINWSLPKTIGEVAFNVHTSKDLIIKAINYIKIKI